MENIRQHFEDEAREFDEIIVRLIPEYSQMVDALVSALPFDRTEPVRVIDLGCGTGTVADRVLQDFPKAEVTCLDLAEGMIGMARAKLARYPLVRYVAGDFESFNFDGRFDAIVSSLALHHLVTDADKKRFYRRVYRALSVGGVFYNADVVLGSTDFLQSVYMKRWREFMSREMSDAEIESKWIPKYQAEDRPAALMKHLNWMTEIGFVDVDVVWKYYNFGVYGGVRR
jgi:tRNA (cmo5U34)-methyltransferase